MILPVVSWLLWVYRSFFSFVPLSSGDWGVYFSDGIALFFLMPQAWSTHFGNGLGGNDVFLLALNTYHYFFSGIADRVLHLPWTAIERLFWYWPFLGIGAVGSYVLARRVLSGNGLSMLAPVVYLSNSYVLMIVGGGQMGVAMGYAVAPYVLWAVIRWSEQVKTTQWVYWSVVAGSVFSAALLFDLRMSYILLIPSVVYVLMRIKYDRSALFLRRTLFSFIAAGGVVAAFHFFWLYPFVMQGTNPLAGLGDAFVNPDMVKFLSFAPFEHTLSLLHPNWPENIFGKIHFLRPEFLILPLLAFSSLMFIAQKKRWSPDHPAIIFFAFIGLTGVFLSKGSNPPLGEVYLWLFGKIPGFVMLRDSTKFYLLTALSYCVLIPFALAQLTKTAGRIGVRSKVSARLITALFLVLWLVIHREALAGKLSGTFSPGSVPAAYVRLQEYLTLNRSFSRVLWVPDRQRYGYFSDTTPGLSLDALRIASPAAFVSWMSGEESSEQLSRLAVSYVIVPTDPKGELFVTDRAYDDAKRQEFVNVLDNDADLVRLDGFGEIAVYKTGSNYGHMYYQDNPSVLISYDRIRPTKYKIILSAHTDERQLIFSETFDPQWELVFESHRISPDRTVDGLQMFTVPALTRETVSELYYKPQRLVFFGLVVSICSGVIILSYLTYATIVLWKKRPV